MPTCSATFFDAAHGLDLPRPWTLRVLGNTFQDRWDREVAAIGVNEPALHADATAAADSEASEVIIGEGADLVCGIEPASKIVARMARQAEETIARTFRRRSVEV